MKNKLTFTFALGVLLAIALACSGSFTTANLSDIKLAKDKDATSPQTTFAPDDDIFAVSSLNNTSSKFKVKFRLLFDDVKGAESGSLAYKLDGELDIEGSRNFWFTISGPSGGFEPGKYKVEFVLMDENNEKEIDKKTAVFTIAGDGNKSDEESKADDS